MSSVSSPSISHRISLRFLPTPPAELTSTVVLNAGGRSNLYTDFRPFLASPSSCEWAFAGTKEYLEDGRCRWTHCVDSRGVNEGILPDVGRCETLPNGDELETGEMINPATGRFEAYEEVWRDEHLPSVSHVMVLRLTDGQRTCGVFIRIGAWAQGVIQREGGVYACRWNFTEHWEVDASFGDLSSIMPAPKGTNLEGTSTHIPEIEDSTLKWEIVEDYLWDTQL